MKRVSVCLFAVTFAIASITRAAEPAAVVSFKLNVRQGENRGLKLIFPTAAGKNYQVSSSRDLMQWELWGYPITGTGQSIAVDFSTTNGPATFFKVEVVTPVALKIEQALNKPVKVTFATNPGRKYLIFSSTDLEQWEASSDLIESAGDKITIEGKEGANRYYIVEEIQATPVSGMVWIKGGKFVMGSSLEEKDRDLDEDPLTQVTMAHGFWMGKFELTQKEYEALVGSNPSWFRGDLNRPVEQVSWIEAMAYCAKLTERERAAGRLPPGYAYRLPTEAEFEYACRAGTTTRFSFGDDLEFTDLGKYAWYNANSGETSHPVGQKLPNAFGLYDMHGNVWEWCLDWYQNIYAGGNVTDPLGPPSGGGRVFRGGGWDYNDASCRSAFRNHAGPGRQFSYVGFRLVLAPLLPELTVN